VTGPPHWLQKFMGQNPCKQVFEVEKVGISGYLTTFDSNTISLTAVLQIGIYTSLNILESIDLDFYQE
jgi:hypothetical protein